MPVSAPGPNLVVARLQQARLPRLWLTLQRRRSETLRWERSNNKDAGLSLEALESSEASCGGPFWGPGGSEEPWASCFCYSYIQRHEVKIGGDRSLSNSPPCAKLDGDTQKLP